MKKKIFTIALFGVALLCCSSCVSLAEKSGRLLDGSASAGKKITAYRAAGMDVVEIRNKAGEHSLLITLDRFPAMKIRASMPDEKNEFYLKSLDYLGGSAHGWNEYSLDLFGQGSIRFSENTAWLVISGGVEPLQLSSGRIRRYDTRITGNEALSSLRNRRERILALSEWMNSRASVKAGSLKEFDDHWKPVLFPELVPKKKRPEGWRQDNDAWVKAEDVRWNSGYSERIFPEGSSHESLRKVRNSGTMLRDWEEALDWIYIEYEWERIWALLSQGTVLTRG